MRLIILILILAACVAFVAFSSGADRGATTLVTPPWTHCLGLHKVTQFHLDIYSGYREKFNDPEGLFCIKLACKDKPDTRRDDDELTVYGLNSGNDDIIYNKSLFSIGIAGGPGEGPMRFRNPQGLTGNADGDLYVADTGNDRIAHLRYVNDELVWAGEIRGEGEGTLKGPSGVCLSGGKLYVADTGNDRIAVFEPDGSFVEAFDPEWRGAFLFRPYAIAAVTAGDEFLYYGDRFIVLTDSLGGRLWKLSPGGTAVALIRRAALGGNGSFGHVAIDYYGNVYVTDRTADMIHKFDRHFSYIAAIGGDESERGPHFDGPRGISIYRRFGQVFIAERAGAQYFWVGTDVLRYHAENLVFDPVKRRCGVDVSFHLTECSMISLVLRDEARKDRFTMIPSYMLPPGTFAKRIEVDCPAAAELAKCKLSLVITASPTYSSREYLTVEKVSPILVSRVSDPSPVHSP
jgi:hypothetical protein